MSAAPITASFARPVRRSFQARVVGAARWIRDRFPWTFSGFVAGFGGAWAFWQIGLKRLDFVVLVLGGAATALVALSTLATLVAAALLRWRPPARDARDSIEGECELWTRTGYAQWRRRWLPLVSVQWSWLEPDAEVKLLGKGPRAEEWVRVRRRGIHARVVRRFDVGDLLGFTRICFERADERKVRFVPHTGLLDRIEVVRGVAGGEDFAHPEGPAEGSPYDLRPYVPGDPLRFVLWKVFARTRTLVVRTPERALSPARHAVAYLVTDASDEPAAGAARMAVDAGALGRDWVLGTDGSDQDADDPRSALDLLARSAHAGSSASGRDLAPFLGRVSPTGEHRAVIFVPSRMGPWVDRVLSAFNGRGGEIEFVVCTDGISEPVEGPWWRRWTAPRGDGSGRELDEVSEVIRALSGPRSRVLVLDRKAGQIFGEAHVQKMAQVQSESPRKGKGKTSTKSVGKRNAKSDDQEAA